MKSWMDPKYISKPSPKSTLPSSPDVTSLIPGSKEANHCTCEGGCPRCVPQSMGPGKPLPKEPETDSYVAKTIEIISQSAWDDLRKMPTANQNEKKAVVVDLMRKLQLKLIHANSSEPNGLLKKNQGKYTTECHYTTDLIVHSLWALGVEAEHHRSHEVLQVGNEYPANHSFPWFPEIELGLSHGDNLYMGLKGSGLSDPATLLLNWEAIAKEWQLARKEYEASKRILEKKMAEPSTAALEAKRQDYMNRFTSNDLAKEVYVPTPDAKSFIVLTVKEVLAKAPAAAVGLMSDFKVYDTAYVAKMIGGPDGTVGVTLKRLPQWVSSSFVETKRILPLHLQNPIQLPSTRDDALQVVYNILFQEFLDEAAQHRMGLGQAAP